MSLAPGTRLGPYEITAQIGVGGMGEVYRAVDSKLKRRVAIKVLPEAVAANPERLARFQREAEVLASLNHPNIAAIYGLEDTGDTKALVMELVDGPTLADRIGQGPIPAEEALPIARQIAEAVEAAHEQGIIHRDLKPANIKVREDGAVKVLDFGLAKALGPPLIAGEASQSPTVTSPAVTRMGVILGTAAYMSPEQAKGKPIDKRADIWGFGCTVYEMLTGKRAFAGDDVTETFAAVIRSEPDWAALPGDLPPSAAAALRRALQKDPRERVRDIADLRLAMEGAFAVSQPPRVDRRRTVLASAIGLIGGALAAATIAWRPSAPLEQQPFPVVRFGINLPSLHRLQTALSQFLAISSNGTRVAYVVVASRDGRNRLFVRSLDQLDAAEIQGLGSIGSIALSPDGEWILYNDSTAGALKKIPVNGGSPPLAIAKTGQVGTGGFGGLAWGAAGTIVFSVLPSTALMRVPEGGGTPERLTAPDEQERHTAPQFLPDGKALLFVVARPGTVNQVAAVPLDGGKPRILVEGNRPLYVESGHLLFNRGDTIWAARFDRERLEVIGEPVPVLNRVSASAWTVSSTGTLAFAYSGDGAAPERSVVWIDRSGRQQPLPGIVPDAYEWIALSPDGARVAFDRGGQARDVWTYDVARAVASRLTTDPADDRAPLWAPDGRYIVFTSNRRGKPELFRQAADGSGQAELMLSRGDIGAIRALDWPDQGRSLLFNESTSEGIRMGLVRFSGDGSVEILAQGKQPAVYPAVSPDGRRIAFASNRTPPSAVYTATFPRLTDQIQVSTSGASLPKWSRDGRELFYVTVDENREAQMMTVPVVPGPSFSLGAPEALFSFGRLGDFTGPARPYDVVQNGARFIVLIEPRRDASVEPPDLTVVQNWSEELMRLVPTK